MYDIPLNKAPCTVPCHIWRNVPFLWPQEEQRQQSSCADFAGHCLLWLLLLRLAAVIVPLLPQNSLLALLAFAPVSEVVSASRISLMASSSFIYFFLAIAQDPQSSALFRLLCMIRHSFRNVIPASMNFFYSESKTDLKLRCDCCINIPAVQGCPRRCYLNDGCMLHVTTPQPLQTTLALQQACLWALL